MDLYYKNKRKNHQKYLKSNKVLQCLSRVSIVILGWTLLLKKLRNTPKSTEADLSSMKNIEILHTTVKKCVTQNGTSRPTLICDLYSSEQAVEEVKPDMLLLA